MDKDELNDLVVDLFHGISYEEEKAVITEEFKDISNKDLHIIDTIGMKEPRNMSSIAKDLNITVGTLTIAINNLLKKGYVKRKRGERDRRVVYISLSEKGKKAYEHHRAFHHKMIEGLLLPLNDEEEKMLIRVMQYFHDYYKSKN
ncbi:MarR family winged helix-turn-helix transcriptional regulator [Anaerostipes sp. MSJ-23]|uniref:MarR family winged helix-turn-helix transcriptional regulator n=1 Tax=unclassified Anaerostipes TaxID=2635253 RepID=UPI001C10454C|nr:MarR family transcriptional regulator [Anaerostipes sp. MSJ-23]MBU5459975.1 MarR family transcriptional regulator [Anaerostipes sp. MSJ-23]